MNAAMLVTLTNGRTLHRPTDGRADGFAALIVRTVDTWRARLRDRNAIATLDRRDLRDLNLSQWEVERELAKPFWRG